MMIVIHTVAHLYFQQNIVCIVSGNMKIATATVKEDDQESLQCFHGNQLQIFYAFRHFPIQTLETSLRIA